jgi:hypothetical protein
MKIVTTSALIFSAALAFPGAALARSSHSGSSAAPMAAGDAKTPKKDSKGKKGDGKKDKAGKDAKSGQAK